MKFFGRVTAVAPQPVSDDNRVVTAVRMEVAGDTFGYFFVDDALAATLKEGEWVSFETDRGRDSQYAKYPEVLTFHPMMEGLALAQTEAQVFGCLHGIFALNDSKPFEEMKDLAARVFDRLKRLRMEYKAVRLPTELLADMLPPDFGCAFRALTLNS